MKEKIVNFCKRYGYYCVAGLLMIGIITSVAIVGTNTKTGSNQDEIPVSTGNYEFGLPMNEVQILKDYSDSELLLNQTLKQYEAHKYMDLYSSDERVFAVLDGTVTDINDSYEWGTSVTITHEGGYKSIYSSLGAEPNVKEGDNVKKGQELGKQSNTASNDSALGDHLKFELFKDDKKINPSNYIEFSNK